jgi:hypothetical protein
MNKSQFIFLLAPAFVVLVPLVLSIVEFMRTRSKLSGIDVNRIPETTMTIIRVPKEVAASPRDGFPLRLDSETLLFSDEQGNTFTVDELESGWPEISVEMWVRENL